MIYLRRGEMQARLSDVTGAVLYGHQAMTIFTELGDPLGEADGYRLFARMAGMKRSWDEAFQFLEKSDELQTAHGCRLGRTEVIEDRGWLVLQMGNQVEAQKHYQEALTGFRELGAEGSAQAVVQVLAGLGSESESESEQKRVA